MRAFQATHLKLDPAWQVDPTDTDFVCGICALIVEDPYSCAECGNNFCLPCIREAKQCSFTECGEPLVERKQKYNRVLQKYLNDLKFNCKLCTTPFTYTERQPHLEE